jgi:hypothetical protein
LDDLISLCVNKSYHIIEIGRSNNTLKDIEKRIITKFNLTTDQHQKYFIYEHNAPNNDNLGIALIINDHLQKHIIKTRGYLNRILAIYMCFGKNVHILLIVVYLPASSADTKITEKCHSHLIQLINS